MRWSKVRQLVEESFAESVRGRVTVHVTNGDPRGTPFADVCHKSWIRLDGETVAYLDRHAAVLTLHLRDEQGLMRTTRRELRTWRSAPEDETDEVMDLSRACWQYLQSNIDASLASPDPFVQALAILSRRVGRRRLRRLEVAGLHPLTQAILRFRLAAEAERDRLRKVAREGSRALTSPMAAE